ncbi:alpha-N-acetylglucosaminidase-like [Culicoides brevitarsis]|uniref:alpha-N-acetylglucosaminidase-like n=1 Tax=Culicoides brevitarsis TaxID=469753 RepID=UPI00307B2074
MIVKQVTIILTLFLLLRGSFAEINPNEQANAAMDVIARAIPDQFNHFRVSVDFSLPKNFYEISVCDDVQIKASSGVAAVRGFYDYLRKFHKTQVAWEGNQLDFNFISGDCHKFNKTSDSEVIYFQNVCTFGYSYAWYTFEDWRKHIDWIAMHGINLVLAPFQEDVWHELYQKWGMTDEEIGEHFAGPTFFPWQRMGNFRGFGGPFSEHFMRYSSRLQQIVIHEYRKLGIKFALPSFAGHVPIAFKRIFPQTKFQETSRWMNFPKKFCCPLYLDPTDELFHKIGTEFLTKMIEKYNSSHIYFADPFNELKPPSNEPSYLKNVSTAIYNVMSAVDPEATWLLQGWMFHNAKDFWKERQMKAFLTAIPLGKMLVLDLHSDQFPQYEKTKSFYGQPFIWCNLHNFGGNHGNFGSAPLVASRAKAAFNNESLSMIGVGITPEGINQNHVVYEFTMDVAWQGKEGFDTKKWFKDYGKNRYGKIWRDDERAWETLHDSVYNYNGLKHIGGTDVALVSDSPSLGLEPWSFFHPNKVRTVVHELLSYRHRNMSKLYEYDVVDFTRQYLQNMIDLQYIAIIDGYRNKSVSAVKRHSHLFLHMVRNMNRILRTNENFLLGKWIKAARFLGSTEKEKNLFEFNARNQVTLWGPNGEISNYGIKQWSGLVKDYMYPRWRYFLKVLIKTMEMGEIFDEEYVLDCIRREIELPFGNSTKKYETETYGLSTDVARKILFQYKNVHIDPKWLEKYLNP